ncbi:hypothetical protein D934_04220 [Xylella fastidiosa subsp. sandyi Ann-1]|uniref:Uncharacterized protein n=1 Tax=Xylella fastidiosa subsp. sandyi Ann-1 TaxID=155920 RepID=A0A060H671_XYLFS|nr:hypothetical protein D934_04220 [Xylella fastidiosa subsp. sandyi Ann-1]AIC13573.1 hypothetical protein P303_02540 [Xylella fastidiosa MUL0034]
MMVLKLGFLLLLTEDINHTPAHQHTSTPQNDMTDRNLISNS